MSEAMRFTMGAKVRGSDHSCGTLSCVVVDPISREVTHLLVEPKHRQGLGRLVPLRLVEASTDEIRLSCTRDAFSRLPPGEETQVLADDSSIGSYVTGQSLYHPFYTMDVGTGPGSDMMGGLEVESFMEPIARDLLPEGEIAIGRGELVHATDRSVGKVQGVVIDPASHRIIFLMLQEGHLWGRRQMTIPIKAVVSIDHGVRLNLSTAEVEQLQPENINHLVS